MEENDLRPGDYQPKFTLQITPSGSKSWFKHPRGSKSWGMATAIIDLRNSSVDPEVKRILERIVARFGCSLMTGKMTGGASCRGKVPKKG